MNLAEFALGLASDRNPKDLKTIERFQAIPLPDGRVLEQKWTVTGSDKYGLPRAGDDDVLLGLLKIGNDQGFASRKVFFSRYDLFHLMEWPLTGPSYTRLQDALDRLAGVRITRRWRSGCWIQLRGMEPGALFCPVTRMGRLELRRMTDQAVLYILQRRAAAAGVVSFSPHDMRRTFISDLLDAGADIATVCHLAGHASVHTTARYDRRGEVARRKAADLLHVPYV